MRAGFRVIPSTLWVLATAALVVACADPAPAKKKDGGHTSSTCVVDSDCGADALCSNNICVTNTCDENNPCPDGYECNTLSLQCIPSASDGGTNTDGGNNAGECSGRCDCMGDNEICVAGKCQQAPSDKSCVRDDQCPLGTICDFSRKCVPGCADTCDCEGSKICNTTTLQCESCSRTNPCPSGQQCNAQGSCEAAVSCTMNSQCSAGQVCKGGNCGFCAQDSECKSYGSTWKCGSGGLCVDNKCDDATCQTQTGDPKAYCNTANQTCAFYDCIGDSDCFGGDTCDLTTHTCSGANPTCDQTCNGQDCASLNQVCDTSTCTCTGNTGGGTNLCGPQNAGVAVKADCTACTIADVFAGTTCYDAADPNYTCTPGLATFLFGILAGFIICE